MKHLWSLIVFLGIAASTHAMVKTRYVVAQDGSGDFTSIQAAIQACSSFPYQRITIFIKNGTYHEKVFVPEWNSHLSLIGENRDSVRIVHGDYFSKINKGPNSTFYTPTLLVEGNDFHAENLTVINDAGPVGQAIAVSVHATRCTFVNCRFLGNQDTLYLTGESFLSYFRDCYVEGTTDFIFGQASAYFESCDIHCKANSYIAAASTTPGARFGLVFHRCRITRDPSVTAVYLGRPWRRYAQTVYLECHMGPFIHPGAWDNWRNPANEQTVLYGEYRSSGPGASIPRVPWAHTFHRAEARRFSLQALFGRDPAWLKPFLNPNQSAS